MSTAEPTPGGNSSAGLPPARVVTIRCRENGPLVVELPSGTAASAIGLEVTDHLGRAFPLPTGKRAVALCRCGHTKTRPFCDGSHHDCGFFAAEVAPRAQ